MQGVVGTSADGSYVYFVANGELIPGAGIDGEPNLYLSHGGQLEFIATLGGGDSRDWASVPAELQAYVTPSGHHLAFMSTRSLTGYDNTDQKSGNPDSEVYAYSAQQAPKLDSFSAPPVAPAAPGRPAPPSSAPGRILASSPFHQPRVLSDSGDQLFFSSPDASRRAPAAPSPSSMSTSAPAPAAARARAAASL